MITIDNISKSFNNYDVLKHINMQIEDNEIVALLGPSGCGKTTLMKIIAGILKEDSGNIRGVDNKISYVFQDDRLLPWRTVWENISLVREKEDRKRIQELLRLVGLDGFENHYPNQLSGGMKKRCGIARAFYKESNLLLMDEPFQGLDYFLRMDMQEMLLDIWKRQRQSVLIITHEIDEALMLANRIFLISGTPASIKKEYKLFGDNEKRLYSDKMEHIRKEIIKDLEQYNVATDKTA